MALLQKTTIIEEYLLKLIAQFKSQPNILGILTVLLNQVQDVENAAFEVLNETTLAASVGDQLDGIGQIVGEERQGRVDADYRVAISARILLNISSGTIGDILEIVDTMTGGLETILLNEGDNFPAGFEVTIDTPIVNGDQVGAFVILAKPAAVLATFRWFEAALGDEFRFDAAGQGFDQGLLGESVSG